MIIKSVEIDNFLIIGHAEVELDSRGLVRISGDNNDDTTSASNGSGKSTIIEAIYWSLFGDTLRSLKSADSVVNNTVKKDCSVILCLEEGDKKYRVERYRKHSKNKNNLYLYINDVDSRGKDNRDTQEFIDGIIDIDKVSFANSIVFGQGYSKNLRRFSELTDKEQKECLENILGVDIYADAHTEAVSELKKILSSVELKTREQDIVQAALDSLQYELEEAKTDCAAFESNQKARLEEAVTRYDSVVEEVSELESKITNFPEIRSEEDIVASINEYKQELASYSKKKDNLRDKYNTSKNDTLVIKNGILKEVASFRDSISRLSDGSDEGEDCIYCGQKVIGSCVDRKRDGIEFEIKDRMRSVVQLEVKIENLTDKYNSKLSSFNEVTSMIDEVIANLMEERQSLLKLRIEVEKLESKLEFTKVKAETYKEGIDRIKLEENPYTTLIKKMKASAKSKQASIDELESEVSELRTDIEYYKFWKIAFSRQGIRSFLLDKVIPFLTEKANNYLSILTDGGITVQFNARKQLASGEWRENFNVEVVNNRASDTYEGNSGGEKRRIDLAISLAINDFIASRSGKRFNILLLDEVFENIDETGVYYVVKVLEELAKNRSSVFVITHHDSLASYFNETITLSRKDGLSYIQ